MLLTDLLASLPVARSSFGAGEAADPDITLLTDSSRDVSQGTLFVAVPGTQVDGSRFIPSAIEQGAVAILATDEGKLSNLPEHCAGLVHAEPRVILPQLAKRFYTPQPETMVAVTGTDGKSSVAHFTRQIWEALDHKAVSLGTIGVQGKHLPAEMQQSLGNTTPGVVSLHHLLQQLSANGITHGVMEASSHGLDQHRLDGLDLKAAAFTNLSRDHLDYHKTEEAYFEAKARLFTELLPTDSVAVLYADDPHFAELCQRCTMRGLEVISYGEGAADIACRDWKAKPDGMRARLKCLGAESKIRLPLMGKFQLLNMMAALGLVVASGHTPKEVLAVIEQVSAVPGRLEVAATHSNGAKIIVDYAHTAGALAHVLQAIREHVAGRLIVLFGCGGDRDRGKRPEMAHVASSLADKVIVTDDNPRSEKPDAIRREVMAGIMPGCDCEEVDGREAAITHAVQQLQPGDILVIAGKGHETEQIIGDKILPFDEKQMIADALRAPSSREAV